MKNISKSTIITTFKEKNKSSLKQMCLMLNIKSKEERQYLKKFLVELTDANVIYKDSKGIYILPEKDQYLSEINFNKKNSSAFVFKGGEKIFIPYDKTNYALDSDKVLFRMAEEGEMPSGEVIKVVKRKRKTITGTYEDKGTFGFVIPDDSKIKFDFFIDNENKKRVKNGQSAIIKISRYPRKGTNPEGKIISIINTTGSYEFDLEFIINKYSLPKKFKSEVLKEAKVVSGKKMSPENRVDLRSEDIFTIDGDNAKDFDDAISIYKNKNNYILKVHIADVSHYVEKNSNLDFEALSRGTSVYLLDSVIPMLPFELSSGVCSLKEGVDRYAVTLQMEIDKEGNIVSKDIFNSIINSSRRLTYREVNRFYSGNTDEKLKAKMEPVGTQLILAKELMNILKENRKKRGSIIDITSREVEFIYDKNKNVIDIKPIVRGESEEMIEEFMLKANETIAGIFADNEFPFVYRIHENPEPEAIQKLKNYLKAIGLNMKIPQNIHPKVLQAILDETKNHPLYYSIQQLVVRSMQRAIYSTSNNGHFGLASKAYTHFTSPIRRYPDLIVHRLLKEYLKNGTFSKERTEMLEERLKDIAIISSKRERVANEAEWSIEDMKKIEYIERHKNETFKTIITSVMNFGLFVEIPEKYISGLVHISTLNDYFLFNEKRNELIGEKTRKVYKIGDELEVIVVKSDKNTGEIDFEIKDQPKEKKRKKRRK
ncbi:MAG: ribonuclease [Kosmotogales bacterium]|nr:ribonuclease [Kosmotogales bacterium]